MRLQRTRVVTFLIVFLGFGVGYFVSVENSVQSQSEQVAGQMDFPSAGICQDVAQTCFSDYHCCSHFCSSDGICSIRPSEYACKRNGMACVDTSECCSGSCLDNRCFGTSNLKSRVGEPCVSSDQCRSGQCGPNNRCRAAESDCLPVGFPVTDAYQCCSQNRVDGICAGSNLQPSPSGAPCRDAYECASKSCIRRICR